MDPLRIAFDVGPLHGHRTGIGHAVAEMALALGGRDDVELVPYLLSFRTRPQPPVRRLPLPAGLAHRLWARSDEPRLERLMADFDVAHGTNYVVGPSRRPRVVSVYDCWFLAHPDQAAPAVRRAGAVLRRSVRHGATVHAGSEATAAAVREHLGTERVAVVPLAPLSPPPVEPTHRPAWADELGEGEFVLALGTLERRKNLPALVRAFGAADELAHTHLVLAGRPGDDAGAVLRAVDALPPSRQRRVVRPGAVSDRDKAWLLAHAGVLAYPSLDEGFGFPVLEAQAASLPVVAARVGSVPEVGGRGVELVAPADDGALAEALVRVLADGELRRRLVTDGLRNLARFSWDDTAAGLVALYRCVHEAP